MSFLFRCNLGSAHDIDPNITLCKVKASNENHAHYYLSKSLELLSQCRIQAMQARIHSKEEIDVVLSLMEDAHKMGAMLKEQGCSRNPMELLKRRRLRQEFVSLSLEVFSRAQSTSDDIMKKILAVPSVLSRDSEVSAGSVPPDTKIRGFVVPPVEPEDQASPEGTDSFFTAPEFAFPEDSMHIPRLAGNPEPPWVHPGKTSAEVEARQDACCDRVAKHLMDMTQVILREMLSSDIGQQRAETIFNNCQIAGGSSAGLLNTTLNAAGSDNRGAREGSCYSITKINASLSAYYILLPDVETITQSLSQRDTMPSDAPEDFTS
ncbi:hypothetical protein BJ138DRAFT_1100747 [Hygrophoropsis aurantiaca]|uniref:Uncharacterized protein n=1 Tax=Hygrophoropsis aurantiaca TaxID=72124 RepID=A0ACB8AF02_9AGAM|nr:hypothetical protein BJ138DRAFT_1100747 [Hygrophoropsis aurantiaca]